MRATGTERAKKKKGLAGGSNETGRDKAHGYLEKLGKLAGWLVGWRLPFLTEDG